MCTKSCVKTPDGERIFCVDHFLDPQVPTKPITQSLSLSRPSTNFNGSAKSRKRRQIKTKHSPTPTRILLVWCPQEISIDVGSWVAHICLLSFRAGQCDVVKYVVAVVSYPSPGLALDLGRWRRDGQWRRLMKSAYVAIASPKSLAPLTVRPLVIEVEIGTGRG